ncbi:MAG: 2,3-diphosphoglycerate-dependent phosphoglycerate mutase [Candidatus Levyibacteriota bacterium]
MGYLVLVRHGESVWNAKGLWTGFTDISLSEKGKEEARVAGELIRDIKFDVAFSSPLKRAIETLDEIKKGLLECNFPAYKDAALNERDYGEFTGKNKWEIKKQYGDDIFLKIRRAWDYPIAKGETLKDVYARTVPYYKNQILPQLLLGKNVLISAHSNSLRALVKYLENISDENISKLEIATGEIYIYQIDETGKIISKEIKNYKPNLV